MYAGGGGGDVLLGTDLIHVGGGGGYEDLCFANKIWILEFRRSR